MGKIFFTSDLHFNHTNIIKYENRPFKNKEEMNKQLIANWNAKVGKDDEIYIMGDIAFGNPEEIVPILKQLNGKKYMIRGNHDSALRYPEVRDCFEWVKDYYVLKHNKLVFVLFHYPIQVWDRQHHGSIHIYGHIHSNIGDHKMEHDIPNSYNAGTDVNGLAPIELNEVLIKLRYKG